MSIIAQTPVFTARPSKKAEELYKNAVAKAATNAEKSAYYLPTEPTQLPSKAQLLEEKWNSALADLAIQIEQLNPTSFLRSQLVRLAEAARKGGRFRDFEKLTDYIAQAQNKLYSVGLSDGMGNLSKLEINKLCKARAEQLNPDLYDLKEIAESRIKKMLHSLEMPDNIHTRLKISDPKWWSQQITKDWKQAESIMSHLAQQIKVFYNKNYVSNTARFRQADADEFLKKWAAGMAFINKFDGSKIAGSKIFDQAKKDEMRVAEYLAKTVGISKLALEEGYRFGALMTITMPSEYHPTTTIKGIRKPNPNYAGYTIKEAHEAHNEQWQRYRASLAKQGLGAHFLKAAQPHKDGTPHYHVTYFLRNLEHAIAITQRMAFQANQNWLVTHRTGFYYGFADDPYTTLFSKKKPYITGIRTDHLTDKTGKSDSFRAAVKYMVSSVQYISGQSNKDTQKGRSNDESQGIKIWASANQIRRFTTSATNATLWRELRRLDDIQLPDGSTSVVQKAAKDGDYYTFHKHLMTEKHSTEESCEYFDFRYSDDKNKYLEPIKVATGLYFLDLKTGYEKELNIESVFELRQDCETQNPTSRVNPKNIKREKTDLPEVTLKANHQGGRHSPPLNPPIPEPEQLKTG